jgi:hypothetical protein
MPSLEMRKCQFTSDFAQTSLPLARRNHLPAKAGVGAGAFQRLGRSSTNLPIG